MNVNEWFECLRRRDNIRIVVLILIAVVCFSLVFVAMASAHRYSSSVAESKTVSLYRDHCGNGLAWWCSSMPSSLYSYPMGVHSWGVEIRWVEFYFSNGRTCGATTRVEHDWVAEILVGEHCWG